MSWQNELVEMWRYVESRGQRPTIIGVIRMARIMGVVFSDHAAREALRPFAQRANERVAAQPVTIVSPESAQQITHVRPGRAQVAPTKPLGFTGANKVFLVPKYIRRSDANAPLRPAPSVAAGRWDISAEDIAAVTLDPEPGAQTSLLGEEKPPDPKPKRPPKQGALPLGKSIQVAAAAFLDAIWPLVQPTVSRTLPRKDWRREQMRDAKALIEARNPDDPDAAVPGLVADHKRLSAQFGAPIYVVGMFKKKLLAEANPTPLPAWKQPEPSAFALPNDDQYAETIKNRFGIESTFVTLTLGPKDQLDDFFKECPQYLEQYRKWLPENQEYLARRRQKAIS